MQGGLTCTSISLDQNWALEVSPGPVRGPGDAVWEAYTSGSATLCQDLHSLGQ